VVGRGFAGLDRVEAARRVIAASLETTPEEIAAAAKSGR
jgi:hypothetical protein